MTELFRFLLSVMCGPRFSGVKRFQRGGSANVARERVASRVIVSDLESRLANEAHSQENFLLANPYLRVMVRVVHGSHFPACHRYFISVSGYSMLPAPQYPSFPSSKCGFNVSPPFFYEGKKKKKLPYQTRQETPKRVCGWVNG